VVASGSCSKRLQLQLQMTATVLFRWYVLPRSCAHF
jgi:hypothetical protein